MACDPVGCLGPAPSAPTEPGSSGCCLPIQPQMCRQVSDWVPLLPYEWASPQRCEWEMGAGQRLKHRPFLEEPVNPVGVGAPFKHRTRAWGHSFCKCQLLYADDWGSWQIPRFQLMCYYHTTVPLSATASHQDDIWFESFFIMTLKKETLKSKPPL